MPFSFLSLCLTPRITGGVSDVLELPVGQEGEKVKMKGGLREHGAAIKLCCFFELPFCANNEEPDNYRLCLDIRVCSDHMHDLPALAR